MQIIESNIRIVRTVRIMRIIQVITRIIRIIFRNMRILRVITRIIRTIRTICIYASTRLDLTHIDTSLCEYLTRNTRIDSTRPDSQILEINFFDIRFCQNKSALCL